MSSHRIIRGLLLAFIVAVISVSTGCSGKRDRNESPCLVTLWPDPGFYPTGNSSLWFCDGIKLNSQWSFGRFDRKSVVDYPVSKSTNAIYLWCNITAKTEVDINDKKLISDGTGCDSLYCSSIFFDSGQESLRSEMKMQRMYARLFVGITGFDEKEVPVKIRVKGTTKGYYVDKSLVMGGTTFEVMPLVNSKGSLPEIRDTVDFSVNIIKQENLSGLEMTVYFSSGMGKTLPIGKILKNYGAEESAGDDFFKDYHVVINMVHGTITIGILKWEKEMIFETEF
ncbi:MAG: hypothetical protein LKK19_03635 [Bacteroidales bacterium]|jgi:hypothetical protein|nr:hypothetical protein [Bacteroidales bacterium]MCI2121778.1 hypothetical protein [Bacteroidales bacterium]MCI2144764.1 hypothetical protein [Bacteroidales bacterium]